MLQYASIIYYHDIMSNNRKHFKSKLDKHTNIVAHHLTMPHTLDQSFQKLLKELTSEHYILYLDPRVVG